MGAEPRMTVNTFAVLSRLLEEPGLAGADLCRSTGLATGTMYPILLRLEDASWLCSEWEDQEARDLGRPRRRRYFVTGAGARAAREHASEMIPFFNQWAIS